ncbi:6b64ba37-e8f2-459c-bf13-b86bd0d7201b [Thermothielavioides terrestris]|jgi:hypothetical protein|uniref:Uncharacterized protein n=2 Tax=Thermothielavioides terrestris TaxID=2587410 RepID=G2QWZ3_THETT|nr:uncharacterized protein THITE_2109572 [Thermothielavioides terrestris NRRL 8126]AEO63959.1 hypothetical protein THITE_2109572 [Thermothielavioides terrestris NRRL 8126]SPQ23301.1 6b64ba37-e8f2-459c-bf13-b86bd0d7201b [Thermothielavioides terrestris]
MCWVKKLRAYRCTHPDCTAIIPSRKVYVKCFKIEEANLPWGSCPSVAYETRVVDTPKAEQAMSHLKCPACARRAREWGTKTTTQLEEWMEDVEADLREEPSRRPALENALGIVRVKKEEEEDEVKVVKEAFKSEAKKNQPAQRFKQGWKKDYKGVGKW